MQDRKGLRVMILGRTICAASSVAEHDFPLHRDGCRSASEVGEHDLDVGHEINVMGAQNG